MAKTKEITLRSSAAEYLTFVSTVGDQPESVELRYQDENIWLTQRLMAELYGVDVRTLNYHIQQIYNDNELTEEATIRNFRIVQTEGTLSGKFTTNAQGKKIVFSQGNLQYQASTKTWQFAAQQTAYLGAANEQISSTNSGWIDLFGYLGSFCKVEFTK